MGKEKYFVWIRSYRSHRDIAQPDLGLSSHTGAMTPIYGRISLLAQKIESNKLASRFDVHPCAISILSKSNLWHPGIETHGRLHLVLVECGRRLTIHTCALPAPTDGFPVTNSDTNGGANDHVTCASTGTFPNLVCTTQAGFMAYRAHRNTFQTHNTYCSTSKYHPTILSDTRSKT